MQQAQSIITALISAARHTSHCIATSPTFFFQQRSESHICVMTQVLHITASIFLILQSNSYILVLSPRT